MPMTMPAVAPAPVAPAGPAVPANAAPAVEATAKPDRPNASQRAAAIAAKYDATPAEPADGDESSDTAPSDDESSSADPAGVAAKPKTDAAPDADAQRRAERAKRLEEFRAKERAADEERQRRNQHRAADGEVEKLRARIAELEPMNEVFKDEESLLAAAEAKGMSAEKLVAWMRKRLTDPAAVAERQAQTVEQKLQAKLDAMEKRFADAEAAREAERRQAEQTHVGLGRAQSFVSQATEKATSHPLTAALLQRRGPAALITFANEVIVPSLPEEYENEQLHDHLEHFLDFIHGGQASPTPDTPASGHEPPAKKSGAAKPVTTLSNALASERATVTEEVPLHKMARKDRERRLKEILERE